MPKSQASIHEEINTSLPPPFPPHTHANTRNFRSAYPLPHFLFEDDFRRRFLDWHRIDNDAAIHVDPIARDRRVLGQRELDLAFKVLIMAQNGTGDNNARIVTETSTYTKTINIDDYCEFSLGFCNTKFGFPDFFVQKRHNFCQKRQRVSLTLPGS